MTLTDANQMVVTDGPWVGATIDTAWTTLPQALEVAANRWRERPALHFVDTGHVESWAELNRNVLTAAAGLHALGVRPGDRVGILLGNVVEFPHAWLGILAVGAVAVPMNPAYTTREVAFVVDDTGMTAAVVAAEHAELIDGLPESATLNRRRTVIVGDGSPGWGVPWTTLMSAEPWQRPYSLGRPEDLANIQYTSGTTGLPKGCMLTHLYWSVLGRTGAQILGIGTSNVLADHPFFYLQNQSYFANAVTTGAQLHVTPALSLSRYIGWLHEFDIDLAWVSDGLLGLPESELDATHRLRLAPSDVIDPALHAALEQRFNLVAREWYASTEIGLGTISPWDDTSAVGSGSMGYPAPLRETKMIDDQGRDLGSGEAGELCVRGPGMMLGYWNRGEINDELFLDGGWFRTGDIVRIENDGQHFFVGRVKDMVRRSGENIAAAEVEQQLAAHPSVADAAVIPVPDGYRGEEIKAIVVLEPGAQVSPTELEAWCRERLASYKVPRYIAYAEELPYTPSGKVRKVALKDASPDLRVGAFDLVDKIQR